MTEKLVAARFGPDPFSLEGIAQLIRALGDIEDDDLRPLAAKLGVSEDSFHIKAVVDVLGISDEPRELPELYSAVRRLLRAEAPVTVVFDDVGAAGPAFFNLLNYLEEALKDDRVIIELRGDPAAPYPMTGTGDDLFDAGLRSLRRSDMPAASAFLSRAAELLPSGEDRLECLAATCDALLASTDPTAIVPIARQGLAEAIATDNERYHARFSFLVTMLAEGAEDVEAFLRDVSARLETARDSSGAAQAAEALAHYYWEEADRDAALEELERALGFARSSNDKQTATRIIAWLCDAVATDDHVSGRRRRIEELAWVAGFSPLVEVKRLVTLARLTAEDGDLVAAQKLLQQAKELQEDLGQPAWVSGIPESGRIEDV